MRSSVDFIEVTGVNGAKKFLINKTAIIFVSPDESYQHAVITMDYGDNTYRIKTKESYKDVAEELLWSGWKQNIDTNWWISPPGEKAPEEENEI